MAEPPQGNGMVISGVWWKQKDLFLSALAKRWFALIALVLSYSSGRFCERQLPLIYP